MGKRKDAKILLKNLEKNISCKDMKDMNCIICHFSNNCFIRNGLNIFEFREKIITWLKEHPKKGKKFPGQMIEDICAIAKESVDWPPTQGQRIHEVLYKYGYKIDRLNNERNT
jgi:hypothetical protein